MPNLEIIPRWNAEINEIAFGDLAAGGPIGNVNIAPKQLAENIFWLRHSTNTANQALDRKITEGIGAAMSAAATATDDLARSTTGSNAVLQGQINSIGGGNIPYPDYAAMVSDKIHITTKMILEVMNDDEPLKNGRYSYDGVTFNKSPYDSLALAKADATSKANAAKTESISESKAYTDKFVDLQLPIEKVEVTIPSYTSGHYTSSGFYADIPEAKTSVSIPVSKGDCYLLVGCSKNTLNMSVVSLLDTEGAFLGSLTSASMQDSTDKNSLISTKSGVYNDKNSHKVYGVIIPKDGYIRISGAVKDKITLYKTSYSGFLDSTQIQAKKESLLSFEGVLHTPIIDSNYGDLVFLSSQAYDQPVQYFGKSKGVVSQRIAVIKGQYIHAQGYTGFAQTPYLIFEDEAGYFLGTQDVVSEYSLFYGNSGHFSANVKSEYTGYFRVSSEGVNLVPLLAGVSDKEIKYHREYLKDNEVIKFYEGSPSSNNEGLTAGSLQTQNLYAAASGDLVEDSNFILSYPYLLKKGDVLEYSLESANYPTLAFVLPSNFLTKENIPSRSSPFIRLNASDIYDMKQGLEWVADGAPANTKFYANAKKGKVAYCNDDIDTVIVFLKPTPLSSKFKLYKQSESYNLRILSKEVYKKIRDFEIADRFTKFSKLYSAGSNYSITNPAYYHGSGSYPPVLLFKGEVLSFLSNHRGGTVVEQLSSRINTEDSFSVVSTDRILEGFSDTPENAEIYLNIPITLKNENSFRYTQIYAKETCVVTPNINIYNTDKVTSLDVEGLIANKHYPARIVELKDIKVGENIEVAHYPHSTAVILYDDIGKYYYLETRLQGQAETKASFFPKNSKVEAEWWYNSSDLSLITAKVDTAINKPLIYKGNLNLDKAGNFKTVIGERTNNKMAIELSEDSLVLCGSETVQRVPFSQEPKVNILNPLMVDTYKTNLRNISSYEYDNSYKVMSGRKLVIPVTKGLIFNFCETIGVELEVSLWTKLQIIQDNKVIAVLNTTTANQGQGSATLSRKNIDLAFYNDKYESVSIQFDNYIEESKVVLKSHLISDKGHFHETVTSNLWDKLRTNEPYPKGTSVPVSAYENLAFPQNQKARGTTFGFPIEVYRGGNFYSLATLRNKKSRENYAMQKNDKSQILIQANWQLTGSVISWPTVNLGNFEVRNPSMKGYLEGNASLPAGFEGVELAVKKIIKWMQDCHNNVVELRTTYMDHINIDSFIDYILSVMASGSPDAVSNNFLLGTHDGGTTWFAYLYDSDTTWGGGVYGGSISTKYNMDSSFFRTLQDAFKTEVDARYAMHRRTGAISVKSIQNDMKEISNSINSDSRLMDVRYWGEVYDNSGLPKSMTWCAQRIAELDTYYNYVP